MTPTEINVNCPKCRRAFRVPPDLIGKRMRCLQCQNVFVPQEKVVRSQSISTSPRPVAPPIEPVSQTPPARDEVGRQKSVSLKRPRQESAGYLWPLAALPWCLLMLSFWGLVWGFVGGLAAAAFSAAGVALMRARSLSFNMRLAGLLALNAATILTAIALAVLAKWTFSTQEPAAGSPPETLAAPWAHNIPPLPISNIFADGPRVYLADLQEFGVRNGPWPFGKNGTVNNDKPIQVGGVPSPKGLSMHPPTAPAYAAARYRLGRQAAVFRATTAINDTSNWCFSPAVFSVLADGKLLWQSDMIAHNHAHSQECNVDVSGVDVMELQVRCINGNHGVHAVWIEPRLLQAADTPDR
jgi:hypothetical protein